MLAHNLLGLDLSHWETWMAPVVGLGSAGLMLIVARAFSRGGKQAPPPLDNLAPLTDPFERGSIGERRSSVRRTGKTVKVLVSDANAKAVPFVGWVGDRSLTGLRLDVTRAVEANMILSVRPVDAG